MALTYATVEDFEAYAGPGWVTDNEEALEAVLARAERDIDSILGSWSLDPATGLKWSPLTELEPFEAAALRDATCAQAQYIIAMGSDFFIRARPRRVSGPDFSEEWDQSPAQAHIGPRVWIELARAPRLRKPIGQGQAVI